MSRDSQVLGGACSLIGALGVAAAARRGVEVVMELLARLAGRGAVAVMGGAATEVRRSYRWVLVGMSESHGVLQSVCLLKLDVGLQWFAEACSEDGDLVWFREGGTVGQVREEGLHVVGDRPLQAKVTQLTKGVAARWRVEVEVGHLHETCPSWSTLVTF
jgi:hypothetical protein